MAYIDPPHGVAGAVAEQQPRAYLFRFYAPARDTRLYLIDMYEI